MELEQPQRSRMPKHSHVMPHVAMERFGATTPTTDERGQASAASAAAWVEQAAVEGARDNVEAAVGRAVMRCSTLDVARGRSQSVRSDLSLLTVVDLFSSLGDLVTLSGLRKGG